MLTDFAEPSVEGIRFGELNPGDTFIDAYAYTYKPSILLKLDVQQVDTVDMSHNVVKLTTSRTEYYKDDYPVWKVVPELVNPDGRLIFKKVGA